MGAPFLKGSTEFWILIICSAAVCLLMMKEIFLSHAIIVQQHVLVDAHETASTDAPYEDAWEKIALRVYKAGLVDPSMVDLLKSENVTIHQGPPPPPSAPSGGVPADSASMPSTSTKPPQAAHP